jgi:hypothetical protein
MTQTNTLIDGSPRARAGRLVRAQHRASSTRRHLDRVLTPRRSSARAGDAAPIRYDPCGVRGDEPSQPAPAPTVVRTMHPNDVSVCTATLTSAGAARAALSPLSPSIGTLGSVGTQRDGQKRAFLGPERGPVAQMGVTADGRSVAVRPALLSSPATTPRLCTTITDHQTSHPRARGGAPRAYSPSATAWAAR